MFNASFNNISVISWIIGLTVQNTGSCLSDFFKNRIGGVIVSVLASSVVDRGLELRYGQTKDYKIGICCISATHAALRRNSKDWLARNQNNVSAVSDISIRRLLFQLLS